MESTHSTIHHVQAGAVLSVTTSRSARLRVLRGSIWLTEQGLSADRFLVAGEEAELHPNANAVLQALRAANVQVMRAAEDATTIDRAARCVGSAVGRWGRAAGAVRSRLHLGPRDELTVAP